MTEFAEDLAKTSCADDAFCSFDNITFSSCDTDNCNSCSPYMHTDDTAGEVLSCFVTDFEAIEAVCDTSWTSQSWEDGSIVQCRKSTHSCLSAQFVGYDVGLGCVRKNHIEATMEIVNEFLCSDDSFCAKLSDGVAQTCDENLCNSCTSSADLRDSSTLMTCNLLDDDEVCSTTELAYDMNIFKALPCDSTTHVCLTANIFGVNAALGCVHSEQITAYQTFVEDWFEDVCEDCGFTWSTCNDSDVCNLCDDDIPWSDDDPSFDSYSSDQAADDNEAEDLWCYTFDAGDDPFNNPFYDRVQCVNATRDDRGESCKRGTHSCVTASLTDGNGGRVEAAAGCQRTSELKELEDWFNQGCSLSSSCDYANPNGVQDFKSCTTNGCNACGYFVESLSSPESGAAYSGLKTSALGTALTVGAAALLLLS
jgi:hypothetical protein